ncbi:MAG: hypothetical protein ACO3LT_09895 [Ilumatobacteraceae bacterium]
MKKKAARKKSAKKVDELTPLQREQKNLRELKAKLQSEPWRMMNLYMIEDKWGNLVHFKPNRAQIQLFKDKHLGGNMILKARQLGISTAIALWLLDKLWTNERHTAGIIDKTLTDAEAKLRKIKIAYENMDNRKVPGWRIGSYIKSQIKITSASSGRIEFSNGSSIVAGKSLRGGTVQYLHVSELGKIAQEEPKKAEEIVSGSLNTIAPGNVVFAESTHEGGRIGLHYKLLKASMENDPAHLSPVDMKFFFFPWFWDPSYTIDHTNVRLRPEMVSYFADLERDHGITLTDGQKAWYDRKESQQTDSMKKEFPTTPDEAFESSTRGAIYARHIAQARAEGRILDFEYEPGLPVVCSWDLGVSDYTSIWALQFVGREIHWLDWYEASGESVSHFAGVMREWDRKYNNIAMHYLPHDAGYRDKNATTYVQHLAEAGITNITVVPRTPDIWMGINTLRDLLKRSLFHKTNCGTPRIDILGDEHLSGIDCLEAYRTKAVDAAGRITEQPIHDESSHSCDAARTISEAYSRGMVGHEGSVAAFRRGKPFKPRVITGTGADTNYDYRKLQAVR